MIHFPQDLLLALDFHLVLEQVRKHASTRRANMRIAALQPLPRPKDILDQLHVVNTWLSLYQTAQPAPPIPTAEIEDCFPVLRVRNACLNEEQFLLIKSLIEGYNDLHRYFQQKQQMAGSIWELLKPVASMPQLPEAIDKVLDRHGVVRTQASSALSRIRTDLSKKRIAADRIFYRTMTKCQSRGVLGEFTESVQGSRRVLAVQAAFKGQVSGIFHGSSAKNSLVYIEPAECIEINNEIALLEDDERKEIYRILLELTRKLADHLEWLEQCYLMVEELDFIKARASYAHQRNCSLPNINNNGQLNWIEAYNPVLKHLNDERKKPTIPLTLRLDHQQRIVVISGPNAGGKSITLKTLGILQLMLQSGLLVPANPRSNVCFFKAIFGDIGDSQSIENELSTYSSRLQKMKRFLELAQPKTLFLIDEFGSGSDPDLGSALAEVFLEELAKSKSFGIITTHYNSIKALAAELPGVENACMEFDQASFSALFTLSVGTPGSSYTFEVAQRSGLPQELVKKAQAKVGKNTLEVDRLLVKIRKDRQRSAELSKAAADLQQQAERILREQSQVRQELEEKLKKQAELNAGSSHLLSWGKKFESLAKQWRKARTQKAKKEILDLVVLAMAERTQQAKKQEKRSQQAEKKQVEAQAKGILSVPIAAGDRVKILGTRQIGVVQSVRKDKYHILFGQILSVVERNRLAKVDERGKVVELP